MSLPDVSKTAIGVARVRAAHSARPDPLFVDPYAAAFVAAAGDAAPAGTEPPSPQQRALAFHVVIRTRYFDDYLVTAADEGCRQVVLLAAGLDARAFRLQWPADTTVFEVDLPGVLAVKDQVLEAQGATPRCDRRVVAADLRDDWAADLLEAGWSTDRPTAWLVEGLMVYLTEPAAEQILRTVTAGSAPGSRLAMERPGSFRDVTAADTAPVTGLWRGGLRVPEQSLAERGWLVEVESLADVAARYARPIARRSDSGFLVATR